MLNKKFIQGTALCLGILLGSNVVSPVVFASTTYVSTIKTVSDLNKLCDEAINAINRETTTVTIKMRSLTDSEAGEYGIEQLKLYTLKLSKISTDLTNLKNDKKKTLAEKTKSYTTLYNDYRSIMTNKDYTTLKTQADKFLSDELYVIKTLNGLRERYNKEKNTNNKNIMFDKMAEISNYHNLMRISWYNDFLYSKNAQNAKTLCMKVRSQYGIK